MPSVKNKTDISIMAISVPDVSGHPGLLPVTGGLPIPRGKAPAGSVFSLQDPTGRRIPLQTSVLRTWDEGSVQWLLVDFQAAKAGSFTLTRNPAAGTAAPDTPVIARRGTRPSLRTGDLLLQADHLLDIASRMRIDMTLTDSRGRHGQAIRESATFETKGPVRASLVIGGSFRTAKGERILGFRLRATLFAGLNRIRLEPLLLVDAERGVLQRVRDLKLHVLPAAPILSGVIGGTPSWQGKRADRKGIRLFQRDDRRYEVQTAGGTGDKAPGWLEFNDGAGTVALAVRDFWQQWPKGLALDRHGAAVELLPPFAAGTFTHMEPWYKYQYLFDKNAYRLRTGQMRRWEVWIDLDGGGDRLARSANAPRVPAADPEIALSTGVWGEVAPAGIGGMKAYDRWAERLYKGYQNSIEEQRDYGEMNWGDWFGERHVNWGNHEYDTSNVLLTQFARTGDPRYFYTGHAAARHTCEVDTIHSVNQDLKTYFVSNFGNPHYPIRPGMMHEHCVGHVGSVYSIPRIRKLLNSFDVGQGSKRPYLCLDPYNLGHVFTRGMARLYFLTGDPWVKDTVLAVGDNLAKLVLDREYPYFKNGDHSGRVNGWTMLALAPAFEIEPARRYLRAMKRLADDALSEQDPVSGGWLYQMGHGHCFCKTLKHVGEAGFIGCVRMNGLCLYHRLTGDPRIPGALKRYVDYLINDTWDERHSDWRYTSCPASQLIGQTGVTIQTFVHSAAITGDPEHIRILKKAWAAKLERMERELASGAFRAQGVGKIYSTAMYGSSEAAALALKVN
jgi:hypothetical protein